MGLGRQHRLRALRRDSQGGASEGGAWEPGNPEGVEGRHPWAPRRSSIRGLEVGGNWGSCFRKVTDNGTRAWEDDMKNGEHLKESCNSLGQMEHRPQWAKG